MDKSLKYIRIFIIPTLIVIGAYSPRWPVSIISNILLYITISSISHKLFIIFKFKLINISSDNSTYEPFGDIFILGILPKKLRHSVVVLLFQITCFTVNVITFWLFSKFVNNRQWNMDEVAIMLIVICASTISYLCMIFNEELEKIRQFS